MRVQVGRVASKKLKQKSKKANGGKRKAARHSAGFKSDSWYANAALSIGVSAKSVTSAQ
jgi:hypothetical protein